MNPSAQRPLIASVFILCLAILGAVLLTQPATRVRATEPFFSNQLVEEIDRIVTAEIAAQGIPGYSLAIGLHDGSIFAKGYGLADVENFVPVTPNTVFRLASISKPITAVAVMQLVEQGKIKLDAPIQQYVPMFPAKRWTITVRHLLSHTSGVRHYQSLAEINSTRHYTNLVDTLEIFKDSPLLFEPGTQFSYTTYGFNLLGIAVETASGERFVDYIRKHIFEPVGINSIQADDVYRIIPHRARGYRRNHGQLENCALADTSNKIPGGGLVGTPSDLVRFAIALMQGKLLKPETVNLMFTPQKLANGKQTEYGLGWAVKLEDGKKWVWHSGGQQGVSTLLLLSPEKQVAVASMLNLEHADVFRPTARIIQAVLQRLP